MKPDDVDLVHTVTDPLVSGRRVLFTLARPQAAQDAYTSQVFAAELSGATGAPGADSAHLADLATVPAARITHGYRDSSATCERGTFALLRASKSGRQQLHVGEHPGATRRLTNLDQGVAEFALAPDAASALVIARIPQDGRYGTDAEISSDAEAPRRIRHAQYLHNGLGYFRDRATAVLEVAIPPAGPDPIGVEGADAFPTPVPLPELPGDASDPRYSPSGRVRSVIAAYHDPKTSVDLRTTVWILPEADPDGSSTEKPCALDLPKTLSIGAHRWLDDRRVVFVAQQLTGGALDFVAQLGGLFLHDRDSGRTTRLTSPVDVDVDSQLVERNGDAIIVGVVSDGAVRLAAVPLDTDRELPAADLAFLTPADAVVTGTAVTPDGGLAFTAATPESFGEVFYLDGEAVAAAAENPASAAVTPTPRALTELGAPADVTLPVPVAAKGPGGQVHGWIATPAGGGPHPVIVNIHGGPFSQFSHGLFDETQVLVSAGYAVVYCNPRGSSGRGHAWGRAVKGDMADPAAADVMAFLDSALAQHPELDAERIGVQGGSYGGYLTAMLIGGPSGGRFTSAIVERGYLVPQSFVGTSDIGRYFTEEYTGYDPAEITRQSPLARTDNVSVPTLVIHSEQDLRCPLEQGQQYFAALQRAGVESEFVVFPGENHELSRSGRPRHRIQRFEAILDWWSRHLPTGH